MKIKSQKGSTTIFVLVALLFYTSFLILMYAASTNKLITIQEKSDIIKGLYAKNTGNDAIDEIYRKRIGQYNEEIENRKLPAEYQQVAYLESTGTQYIDTGLKLNQNSRVKIKYQYSEFSSSARIFGDAHDTSKGWILTTADGLINTKIQTLYNSVWSPMSNESSSIIPSTNIVKYERNGIKQYVNGNLYYTNLNTNFETASTVTVFGAYYNSLKLSSVKIYELLIWKDGTNITRYFKPCYRKSDYKPGLYDLVNDEFYTNQGTGEFEVEQHYVLPSEYQQLEYIESTGTQYINTKIVPTVNTGIDIDYSYSVIDSFTPAGLCGIYQPNRDTLLITTYSGKTNSQVQLLSRGANPTFNVVPTLNTKYNAKINWLNNNQLSFNKGLNYTNGTGSILSKEIILFGREYNGSYAYTSARIYGCKFSESNSIIRNYIPCKRKSDNKPGLFDLVENKFYTNQGTGEFVVGPDVD